MVIFNYNKIFKEFDYKILYYAKKIDFLDWEDSAQEIRMYIFKNLYRFFPNMSSLSYYIYLLIVTSYRKIIYDKKKQVMFEESFSNLQGTVPYVSNKCNYKDIISEIVVSLKDEINIVVFYSLLYNKGEKTYFEIAKMLNMDYPIFLKTVIKVKRKSQAVCKEFRIY